MKGKYAAKAARRREDESVQSEIEGYQHTIKRLTAERDQLRNNLAARQAEHKQETRRLRDQLDEGLAPELVALREQLEQQRERANAADAQRREVADKWHKVCAGLHKILRAGLGLTPLEAWEVIAVASGRVAPSGNPAAVTFGIANAAGLSRDEVLAIQAGRGDRGPGDVVKMLRDRVELLSTPADTRKEPPCSDSYAPAATATPPAAKSGAGSQPAAPAPAPADNQP